MNNIVINETSLLYKFFELMGKTPIGSIYIDDNDGTLNTFNDICTFVRHLVITLFIAIPVQLLIGAVALYFAFMGLLYLPLKAFYLWISGFDGVPLGIGAMTGYIVAIVLYAVLCILQNISEKVDICDALSLSDDNPIKTTLNIVSQKHNNFCKRLVVKTKDDLEAELRQQEEQLKTADDESKLQDEKIDSK